MAVNFLQCNITTGTLHKSSEPEERVDHLHA